MVEAIAALMAPLAVVVSAYITHIMSKKIDKVDEKVATSNGHTTGQLVEMLSADIDKVKLAQEKQAQLLAEHTVLDDQNFRRLDARIKLLTEGTV